MIARDKNGNRIKWRVADQLENDEKLALGYYKLWFILSNQPLQDRAGAMFCGLFKPKWYRHLPGIFSRH